MEACLFCVRMEGDGLCDEMEKSCEEKGVGYPLAPALPTAVMRPSL